ncbi:hypothetical protein ABXS75_16150 [Roseburia hominis]
MKMSMTDIMTDIPVEELENMINKKAEKRHQTASPHRRRYWHIAAIFSVICILAGCTGYAVLAYPEIFSRYFGKETEELSQELIQIGKEQAKNGNYNIAVEAIMADQQVKRVLISVTALNDESWLRLNSGENVFHMIGATSTEECTEKEAEKGSYTKYYLCKLQNDLNECTAVVGEWNTIWKENTEESVEYFEKSNCLLLPVQVAPKSERSILIYPENTRFLWDIPLETIEITPLAITLSGTAENELAIQENKKKQKPEILAETKDGKTICLLYEATTPLSPRAAEADEFQRINLAESNHGSKIPDSNTARYQAIYPFVQALDTAQIQKIWINGTEYPFNVQQ